MTLNNLYIIIELLKVDASSNRQEATFFFVFVRSGDVALIAGVLRDAGITSVYWASRAGTYTSSTSATAYRFGFTIVMYASYADNRWYAFPLRCLSTVLGM